MLLDVCPACQRDRLELHSEPDGDETGVWITSWYECAACHRYVPARNLGGTMQPFDEDWTLCNDVGCGCVPGSTIAPYKPENHPA